MENKMSKEYVAELLKQLEELKRKKALKEKKLQKLKGCSVNDLKKGHVSSRKASAQETTVSEMNIPSKKDRCYSKSTNSDFNLKKMDKDAHKNVDSFQFDDNKVNRTDKIYSEMGIQKLNEFNVPLADYTKSSIHGIDNSNNFKKCDNLPNDVFKSDDTYQTRDETDFIKSDGIHIESDKEGFVSKKRKSSTFDEDKSCYNDEKINSNVETFKLKENIVHNMEINMGLVCDEDEKKISVAVEIASPPASAIKNEFYVITCQDKQTSSHSSKKSSPSSKNKSSDLLDDSLNEKMSFLSSDLFDNNYDERKETTKDCTNVHTCNENIECQKEKTSELVVCDHKTILPTSISTFTIASHENNFNFPKFSTPTDILNESGTAGLYQSNKDEDMLDLKLEKQEASGIVKSAFSHTEIIHSVTETKVNNYSQNKFDPSLINNVIGKELSSVLDAHYESPKKTAFESNPFNDVISDHKPYSRNRDTVLKKRKLFDDSSFPFKPESQIKEHNKLVCLESNFKSNDITSKPFENTSQINDGYLDNTCAFRTTSDSFSNIISTSEHVSIFAHNSCDDVPSQVTKTIDGLLTKVCENSFLTKNFTYNTSVQESDVTSKKNNHTLDENMKINSEIQVIPETEGLELYFSKDSDDFLETSTLSQNLKELHADVNLLNVSSHSELKSPVLKNIVEVVKSSKNLLNCQLENSHNLHSDMKNYNEHLLIGAPEQEKANENIANDTVSAFDNSLGLDTSFLEDDTQELGHFKQVPYLDEVNVQNNSTSEKIKPKTESNLNFLCSLYGTSGEPVIDVEVIVFSGVKYAFIQHVTQIHVWRQERKKGWIKIFSHHVEDMMSLVKICVTMDDDNLIIVMLLSDYEKFCLQFLLFEKDTRVIKLMENTHWLEERTAEDSFLICGLNGLMFATAQNGKNPEVSLHAFISLKENPRLMTAVLGSTENSLCSLCKIDKLPNALMGISDSMLYVWHILEARLVTAVSLHPHDYFPIKECFWATVENGLVYFLTTCEGKENHQVCQLLAANLATGYCQSAMTYSTRPSDNKVTRIIKAAYLEPFLVVTHSNGAFMWSVTEEFCCAALSSKSNVTTVALSKDFENWGLVVLGSKFGCINCYSIN